MTDQYDPVLPNEFILRRVPHNRLNPWVNPDNLSMPVDKLAFRPTDNDDDGLSVFRELFVTAQEIADEYRERTGKECYIIRIGVNCLVTEPINVDVQASPIKGGLPGHAVIPQLNLDRRNNHKEACKDLQQLIARNVTLGDIVYSPQN